MKPKPGHLGLKYAEQFKDSSIAEAYHHRPLMLMRPFASLLSLLLMSHGRSWMWAVALETWRVGL